AGLCGLAKPLQVGEPKISRPPEPTTLLNSSLMSAPGMSCRFAAVQKFGGVDPGCVKTRPCCRAARSTRARIERVAQAVADQVEGKNSKKNCKPRPNGYPGRIDEETLGGIEHAAPRRRGRLLAK